jgi:hypothetical protein
MFNMILFHIKIIAVLTFDEFDINVIKNIYNLLIYLLYLSML